MGRLSTPLLRRAKARTIIAGRKFGSDAGRFADEFQQLAEQCAIIRAGAHDPEIQATAFFHLRFENIHPLTDCNGRLGRLILAEQIRRSYDVPLEVTLGLIHNNEAAYRRAFVAPQLEQQFKQMVRLVGRIVGTPTPLPISLRFSILPIFPEKNTKIEAPKSHGSKLGSAPRAKDFKQRPLVTGINRVVSNSR